MVRPLREGGGGGMAGPLRKKNFVWSSKNLDLKTKKKVTMTTKLEGVIKALVVGTQKEEVFFRGFPRGLKKI